MTTLVTIAWVLSGIATLVWLAQCRKELTLLDIIMCFLMGPLASIALIIMLLCNTLDTVVWRSKK